LYLEEAEYHFALVSQHSGFQFVSFGYSRILIFEDFDDDSEDNQYLDWHVGLVFLCFSRPSEDGALVPIHVGVDTVNYNV